MTLSVAVRVDASPKIGIGHVMRCLTLADALARRGASVNFVSRHLPPHLQAQVRARGHECMVFEPAPAEPVDELDHADWLETSQGADVRDTLSALAGRRWDWIAVDHYALDARWETAIRSMVPRVLAIDDTADRRHDCDLLLDQNTYPDMLSRYDALVPAGCERMIGPRYALVREEFREWRVRVAPRTGTVRRIMVCFGGVDAGNMTAAAVEAIGGLGTNGWTVDVVIGASHPRLAETAAACDAAGYNCYVQSDRMAELMAAADLALGAAGSTSWERCCVGLPTVCVATAHNQVAIARGLEERGVAVMLATGDGPAGAADVSAAVAALLADPVRVAAMSRAAWDLVDGLGVARVCDRLLAAL